MQTYELRTKFLSQVDGATFQPGAVVATITTAVKPHQLQSMFSQCEVVQIESAAQSPAKQVEKSPESSESPPTAPPAAADSEKSAEHASEAQPDISAFAGLSKRVAVALVKAGYHNADDIDAKLDAEPDFDLIDIKGVSKAGKAEIEAWLDTQGASTAANSSDEEDDDSDV